MAYFRKIEEAESCLSRGDLLGAEALLASAQDLHSQSRFRAPLVERGIDPVLRVGRRLLRRAGSGPVLPNFPARARCLQGELAKLAARREREAADLALVEDAELLAEHTRACEAFLLLHRESRFVQLPSAIVWRLLRSYLITQTDSYDGIEAGLVPDSFDVPEDQRGWLGEWVRVWLRVTEGRPAHLAMTLLRWAENFARGSGDAAAAPWCSLAARLSLVGAMDGPRALRWGRLALELPLGAEEAWANLRLVASLECNQSILATSGAYCAQRLRELGRHPAAEGRVWPPNDLEEMLRRRDPEPESADVVVANGSHDGRSLLLLRIHREKPVDAVLLRLESAGDPSEAFGVSPAQGREAVESWLHPGDMVLVATAPAPALGALFPRDRTVVVEELESALPASCRVFPAAPGGQTHPLFHSQSKVEVWNDLYLGAREILPRAIACLHSAPSRSAWGRENLRRLAAVGLRRCQSLVGLVEILFPEVMEGVDEAVELQELPLEPCLRWPVLADRQWPDRAAALSVSEPGLSQDLVIAHRPTIEELATEALAMGRVAVLMEEESRCRELAAVLAASVDARDVTWQRHAPRCPRAELQCLGNWVGQALSDDRRELDVLWLYQGLCCTPEAAVEPCLDPELRPEAWAELQAARLASGSEVGCGSDCELHQSPQGCWPEQLEVRRRGGRIWLGSPLVTQAGAGEALLVDDLSGWVCDPDPRVLERLERLRVRLAASTCFVLHADAGAFGDNLAPALRGFLPPDRCPVPHTRAWAHSIDVLAVPAGYSPSARLLGVEAEALLHERLRLWDEEVGSSPRWIVGTGEAEASQVSGRATEPRSKVVLVPRLGETGEVPPLVQLLRLALASTHSSQLLVCLDPRLAQSHPQLLRRVHLPTLAGLGAKGLASGAEIFGAKRVRCPESWKTPLSADRLRWALNESVAVEGTEDRARNSTSPEELAAALGRWTDNPRLAVAGATDDARRAVARLLLELARESGDGAALGIRCVVWVGDGEPPFEVAGDVIEWDPGVAATVPDRGARAVIVSPSVLVQAELQEWAAGLDHSAWILGHAEVHLREGSLAQGWLLPRLPVGSRLLAWSDDPKPEMHEALARSLEAVAVPIRPAELPWTWKRHRAPDHEVQCGSCGFRATVEHPMSLCGRCGALVLKSEECESASRQQRVAGLREQLTAGDTEVLVVAVDRGQRDELRHQLGLAVLDQGDGSLWEGRTTSQAFGHDVVTLVDLCGSSPNPSRVLLDHLPSDASILRGLVLRLSALGWPGACVEALDHPLQWHCDRPLRRDAPSDPWSELAGRRLRWEAGRAEIEFRYGQALTELRRRLSRQEAEAGGRFFADSVVRAGTSSETALFESLRTDDPGRSRILADDAELFVRAGRWMSETLDRVVECGLQIDPPRGTRLLLSELDETPLLARRAALLLAWSRRERLLSAAEVESEILDELPMLDTRLRRSPRGEEIDLDLDSIRSAALVQPAVQVAEGLAAGDYLALPVTGRTRALQRVARARSARGERVLCLLPESSSVLRWNDEMYRTAELEVMTVSELAVAIVAEAAATVGNGASPRPLPPAGSVAGEEIRQSLMREVSRLYAQRSGRVPPVDGRALRRLLEEEGAVARMASVGEECVDVDLLRECIGEARQRHGWLEERDLFDVATDRIVDDESRGDHWRRHFDAILIDDAHALDDRASELLQRVFVSIPRWKMADPWQIDRDDGYRDWEEGRSAAQVPRQIASSMDVVARTRPVVGWKMRTARGVPRGQVCCDKVLNLETCVRHIHQVVSELDEAGATHAVVLGHEVDRRQTIFRLREEGHRVWDAEVVARYAAAGPRDLLALAILVFESDLPERLSSRLHALMRQSSRWDFSDLAANADGEDEVIGLADCVAASVLELRAFVGTDRPLRELLDRARLAGLLEAVRNRASSRNRLEEFLTLTGARSWDELRHQIDFEAVADPSATAGVIWALRPRDLHGLRFDHVFHVCSGCEPATRHLLVASRARRSLHVLYSELDPFATDV